MKKLGVIILNWNGRKLLQQLLPCVSRDTICDQCDLIVADNGSDDGSVDWIRQNCPEVKILAFDRNYGFAEGYNRAIKECEYPFVTLLNSDVETTPDWWKPVLGFMESHPDAGAVQPKIRSFYNRSSFEYAGAAGGALDNLGYPYCRGRLFDAVEEDRGQYDGEAIPVAWASGACLTVPRDIYLQLGGLDAGFFAHMEEIDLCARIWNSGFKCYAISGSSVYHMGGASLNQGNPQKTYLNFRNNLLLIPKNMTRRGGNRMLLKRRLADTLAWAMFLLKFDFANARAVLKAHKDFRRMRKNYNTFPDHDVLTSLPGSDKSAIMTRYLRRKTSLPF